MTGSKKKKKYIYGFIYRRNWNEYLNRTRIFIDFFIFIYLFYFIFVLFIYLFYFIFVLFIYFFFLSLNPKEKEKKIKSRNIKRKRKLIKKKKH